MRLNAARDASSRLKGAVLFGIVVLLMATAACTNRNDERVPLFDYAIELALKDKPAEHAGIARWAHQFMMGREAWEILEKRGYRCIPGVCIYEACPTFGRLEVLVEGGEYPLRHAVGRRMVLGRELQRVEAPGMVFPDAQSFTLWIAGMISSDHVIESSPVTSLPVRAPGVVRVHGYYELLRKLARRGFSCGGSTSPSTRRCENRSFSGQSQVVLITFSPGDFSPRQLEGQLDGKIARIALEGPPRPAGVYVPPPGRPFF